MRKLYFVVFLCVLSFLLTACKSEDTEPSASVPTYTQEVVSESAKFLSSGLKERIVATDSAIDPARVVTIELYVDAYGNGKGLLGFGDYVLDVAVVDNAIYMFINSSTVVKITDITARGYFSSIDVANAMTLNGIGFSMNGDIPAEYNGRSGSLTIRTQYVSSSQTFTPQRVSDDNQFGLHDAINYAIDYYTDMIGVVPEEDEEAQATPQVVSFYTDSQYGITIEDLLCSIGDTCNPDTYFAWRTPEGILLSSEYKEDSRVDFYHVTYISSTGRTQFVLLDNYVRSICTNANFDFWGFSPGMTQDEVRLALGYKLSKQEEKSGEVHVYNPYFIVDSVEKGVFKCHIQGIDDIVFELRCVNGLLYEIYMERTLDFIPEDD